MAPDSESQIRLVTATRICGWFLAALIVVLSLVPSWLRPVTGAPHNVEHFAIFALTGAAFAIGYRPTSKVAAGLVLFAGAVELAQLFDPGRHARLSDFIVDAVAALIGLAVAAFARAGDLAHRG
jgi:VanZ family protein